MEWVVYLWFQYAWKIKLSSGIYRLEGKFDKYSGGRSSLKLLEIWENVFLCWRLSWRMLSSRTRVAMNTMFVYHFVDLDLGVEILFEKGEAIEKEGFHFEVRDWSTSARLYWAFKKIFHVFSWGGGETSFESSIDLYLHPLLESFHLPNCGSESKKWYYTLRLIFMYLEPIGWRRSVGGLGVVLPVGEITYLGDLLGGDWEVAYY